MLETGIFQTCKDCGEKFHLTPDEVKWYEKKGLATPKRCKKCRTTRKANIPNNSVKERK